MFNIQRQLFPKPRHHPAQNWRKQDIDHQIDHEQPGHLFNRKAELFDHHKACKHHKYLPPRARHQLQRVIQPIAAAQDHVFMLRMRRLELWIGQQAEQRYQRGYPACHHINCVVIQRIGLPGQHNRGVSHQRCPRSRRHQPAQHLRRAGLVDPLHLQGLVDRFEIMKPDRRQHRHRQDAAHCGEMRGDRGGHAQQRQCDHPQHLFADEQQQRNHPDGQEPRDLAHRVQPTDV